MRRVLASVCMISLLIFGGAHAVKGAARGAMPDGYAPVPVTNDEVGTVADYAIRAQQQVMREKTGEASTTIQLVSIQTAGKQIDEGTSYRLVLKVELNGKEKVAKAIVLLAAWRKPEPYQLTSWHWK